MAVERSSGGITHLCRDGVVRASLAVFRNLGSIPGEGISALDHESVYHAVEQQAVIVACQGKFFEIVPVARRIAEKAHLYSAQICDDIEHRSCRKGLGNSGCGNGVQRLSSGFFRRRLRTFSLAGGYCAKHKDYIQ